MMGIAGMTEVLAAAVLLLVFLYQVSHVFRYYAKFVIFTLLSLISATIFIPLMLIRPRDYRNALYPAWGARQISKLLGIHFEMRGLENAVQDTGCVVVINHQSALDLLVLAEIWPKLQRCTVISKKEVLYLGPFGLASWLWGTIFINRLNGEQAQITINNTGEIVRTKKAKLCMFPEGTRNNGVTLLSFKKGAFHVAISSQTPVQPIVVSRYYFLDDKKKIFDSGSAIITILPPVQTEGMSVGDLNSLMTKTRDAMIEVHSKTSDEVIEMAAKTAKNLL